MILIPAIDIYEGKVVRLRRGRYDDMTVYPADPLETAQNYAGDGAGYLHVVDLEGARTGGTPNLELITRIIRGGGIAVEVGGGVRDGETVERYLSAGAGRVILGTAAVTKPGFVREQVRHHGGSIAVGVDISDGYVAIKGWTELSKRTCVDFFTELENDGVQTVICTDISRDGAMCGTNLELYTMLSEKFSMNIVASGGVSSLADVQALSNLGLYGTILGKALYEGGIELAEAVRLTEVRQ